MIHSIFGKNKPVNFIIILVAFFLFFVCYEAFIENFSNFHWQSLGSFLLIIFTLFITDAIDKSNFLTDNNSYAIFFFSTTFCFFPYFLEDIRLITTNLLIITAIFRLTTLWKKSAVKQKIFDSSLLITIASLFYNWSILFLLLVWISVILHTPKSLKNIFIPIVAMITIGLNIYLYSILSGNSIIIEHLLDFKINSNYVVPQSLEFWIPISLMLLFSLIALISYHSNKKEKIGKHRIPELLSCTLFISLIIIVFTEDPTKTEGILTLLPFSILMTFLIEKIKKPRFRNTILYLFAMLPFGLLLLHFITKG